jgi:hypothetical protein
MDEDTGADDTPFSPSKSHRADSTVFDPTTAPVISPRPAGATLDGVLPGVEAAQDSAVDAPGGGGSNCLVKMYDFRSSVGSGDDEDGSSSVVKLNDMVEIIGIYNAYIGPASAAQDDMMAMISGDPFFGFDGSESTPGKLANVPTVHCIVFRKLCSAYPLYRTVHQTSGSSGYELLPYGNAFSDIKSGNNALPSSALPLNMCYDSVVRLFSEALGGDTVSASYLALAIVSGVSSRPHSPDEAVLGSLTLNIYGVQPGDPRVASLAAALRKVLPRVMQTRLDRDALASPEEGGYRFFAEKSTATESIDRSSLQLGAGTALLVDETQMTEGPVTNNAVRSMKALESVVKTQLLPVEFEYCHGIKIPTDVCVIILSNSASIIGDNVIKCFSPTAVFSGCGAAKAAEVCGAGDGMEVVGSGDGPSPALSAESFQALRQWWARSRLADASLDQAMIAHVEEDFVRARQGKPHQPAAAASVSASAAPPATYPVEGADFHNWLTLSRLQAMADGSPVIAPQQWSRVRQLESDRYHNKARFEAQL